MIELGIFPVLLRSLLFVDVLIGLRNGKGQACSRERNGCSWTSVGSVKSIAGSDGRYQSTHLDAHASQVLLKTIELLVLLHRYELTRARDLCGG